MTGFARLIWPHLAEGGIHLGGWLVVDLGFMAKRLKVELFEQIRRARSGGSRRCQSVSWRAGSRCIDGQCVRR